MSQRKQWPTVQAAEVPEHVSRQTIKKDNIAKFASEAGHGMSLLAKISAGGMMPKRPQAAVTHEGQGQRAVSNAPRTEDTEREREELKRETGGKQKTLLTMIAPPSGQDYRAVLKSRGAVTVGASAHDQQQHASTEQHTTASAQPIKILPPPTNTATVTPKRSVAKTGSAPTTPSAPIDYRAVLKKSTPDKTAHDKEHERLEKERVERENKAREEQERLDKQEKERVERENKARAEQERLDKQEKERVERENKEREEKEKLERERIEREEQDKRVREEQERAEKERAEQEKHEREEKERVEREEREKQERERAQQEQHDQEERVRVEREQQELRAAEELAKQREAETERLQREEDEKHDREEHEKHEREEHERLEKEKLEKERTEREEKEKQERERENREREEKEKLEREQSERARVEQEERDKQEKERVEREEKEKAERERVAHEQAQARLTAEREAQEQKQQSEHEDKQHVSVTTIEVSRAQSQSTVSTDEARARREAELAETQRIEEQIKLRAEQLKSQSPRRDNVPALNLGKSPVSPRSAVTKHSPREFKPVTPRSANILSRVNIFETLVKKASEEQLTALSPRKTSPRPTATVTPRAPLNKAGSTFTNRPPTQGFRSIVTTPLAAPAAPVTNNSKDYMVPESTTGTYTYEELIHRPANLERSRLEAYLSDEDFERVFKVRREVFNGWPKWKQTKAKQELALF